MKKILILTFVAAAIVAGAIIYSKTQKAPSTPPPTAETALAQPEPQPQEVVSVSKPQPVPAAATQVQQTPAAAVTAAETTASNEETNSIRKTVDALLAAHANKHTMLEQLRKDGQLEAVIAELQKRNSGNSTDPGIPTTLAEAQLNLVRQLHESGADENTVGILALQADQNFNAALKIDPQNWEAQYVKASTMYYWPANETRDNDAARRLASLIDQQEAMPSQPDYFAQTYVALGKQYQKMGKMPEAIATWQLGAQKFPGNADLQKLKAGQ